MSTSRLEYPLTLAEVLFEELENTCPNLDKSERDLRQRIEEIRDVPTSAPEQIRQILGREGIDVDLSHDYPLVIWRCKQKLSAKLVPNLYQVIHGLPARSALCLSGGGVSSVRRNPGILQALIHSRGPKAPHSRSAIFNLGILQGLARCGLLDKFDYLSTVSGGGFIGSWLSAWIYREGGNISKVAAQLAQPRGDPLMPEPDPIYNLRVYANYVTPKRGLLSVDTWTLVVVYFRNLLLNWLVFVPVIMMFLMLPRIWVAFVKSSYIGPAMLLGIGFAGAAIALIYIGLSLPGARQLNLYEAWFINLCLLPLVISAMGLTTYWVRLGNGERPGWRKCTLFALVLGTLPWILNLTLRIVGRFRDTKGHRDGSRDSGRWALTLGHYASATMLILIAFALFGFVTWYLVNTYFPPPLSLNAVSALQYATLAVPVLLILLIVGLILISGLTSRFTDVDDQEWWARAIAWVFIVLAGWIVLHVLVLFGPSLVLYLERRVVIQWESWDWTSLGGLLSALVTVISLVSGALTLFGGFRPKATTGEDADQQNESRDVLLSIVMGVATTISAAFILIFLVFATNWILASNFGEWIGKSLGAETLPLNANDPIALVYSTPLGVLLTLYILFGVVGAILGRLINANRFSLHFYWRNRIMRAYLGASRSRAKTKNKFTDFDPSDNLAMCELKQKPLQVVNAALNLAGGDKLEWQDRKADSFTISPLHAGNYWLGYRNSRHYGGAGGISLASSIAISGAGVSPSLGNTLTSPVVRFIMIFFNVRLGCWLGNSGVAGSGNSDTLNRPTFVRDSPAHAVRPIFSEALGMTNGLSPYVYLSDGGEYENLGLQEMILRRCRFIVVSDTSTDPDYSFQSLAQAIRQVRVDFGVPIEIEEMHFGKELNKAQKSCAPEEPHKANKYCAIGIIRYSAVDKLKALEQDADYDGVLIYIKPSLDGSEPADVLNYHKVDDAFPQGTNLKGFTESQFESYRRLGSHMIQKICRDPVPSDAAPFESFVAQVKAYLRQTP